MALILITQTVLSLSPFAQVLVDFFSLSFSLALCIVVNRFFPFVFVVVERRKTAINAHHHTEALVDYVAWRFKFISILLLAGKKSAFRLCRQ
jgi:hypothetical protein